MVMWIGSFTCKKYKYIFYLYKFFSIKETESDSIKMVDGDYLTCLFGLTLKYFIQKLSKSLQAKFLEEIKIGVVCTAYSNGAFMNYIQKTLNFPLLYAKTGVKHLHHKAKNFDIAVYFESNGHGTVYSHEEVLKKIQKLNCFIESSGDSQTLELISIFLSMFNRTTGDSLSALIAVESSLKLNNMKLLELYNIYTELESVNVKVIVKDKHVFVPNEDDTRLIQPVEIQNKIDETVSKYSNSLGRCFVRPSGTEDIVRIYAEAVTLQEAKDIAEIVKQVILEYHA
jgi:phosphoacetylglucosamine mutase